jgi:hypothetical protein
MNRDDIIRMAHDAGLHIATDVNWMPIIGLKYLEKFSALVAAAEREACIENARTVGGDAGAEMEKLIRARGQE